MSGFFFGASMYSQVRLVCGGGGRLAVCRWRLGSASGAHQYPSAGSGELRVSWPNYLSGGGVLYLWSAETGSGRRSKAAHE